MKALIAFILVVLAITAFIMLTYPHVLNGARFLDVLSGAGTNLNISYIYLHFAREPDGVPVVGGKVLASYIVILGIYNPMATKATVTRVIVSIPYAVTLHCGGRTVMYSVLNSSKYEGVLVDLTGRKAAACTYSLVEDLLHGFNHYIRPVTIPPHSSIYIMLTGVVEVPGAWVRELELLRRKPIYILAAATLQTPNGEKAYTIILDAEKLKPINAFTYYYSTIPGGVTTKLDNSEIIEAWIISGRH